MFQSTHPRRVWLWRWTSSKPLICFNPHTHEGCDSLYPAWSDFTRSFNPHTHEGCDDLIASSGIDNKVSIHTPTKGVTCCWSDCSDDLSVSIHTPTKGVTFRPFTFAYSLWVSIHTPTKGVTMLQNISFKLSEFQSTHPRRVWPAVLHQWVERTAVSIHTPTKGVT